MVGREPPTLTRMEIKFIRRFETLSPYQTCRNRLPQTRVFLLFHPNKLNGRQVLLKLTVRYLQTVDQAV